MAFLSTYPNLEAILTSDVLLLRVSLTIQLADMMNILSTCKQ